MYSLVNYEKANTFVPTIHSKKWNLATQPRSLIHVPHPNHKCLPLTQVSIILSG